MARTLFLLTSICFFYTAHAADTKNTSKVTEEYTVSTYDDSQHHDEVFAYLAKDLASHLPPAEAQNLDDDKKALAAKEKLRRSLHGFTPMHPLEAVEGSFRMLLFRDDKGQLAGVVSLFVRKDNGKALVDTLEIIKRQDIPRSSQTAFLTYGARYDALIKLAVKTILSVTHDELKARCLTIHLKDPSWQTADETLEYSAFVEAGFKEGERTDLEIRSNAIRLEHVTQI